MCDVFSPQPVASANAATEPTVTDTTWMQVGESAWNNGTRVAFSTVAPYAYVSSAAEDGTAEKPYLIENATDFGVFLYEMSRTSNTHSGKYFKITADIDFGEYYLKNSSYGSYYNANFAGVLDGNEKTLSNVFIRNAMHEGTGIFNTLSGSVTNLSINNAVVYTNKASDVGVLAGKLSSDGVVSGVNVINSTVTATSAAYVGGIVGYSTHSASGNISITDSSVRDSVICGSSAVGGILGAFSPVSFTGSTRIFNMTSCLSSGNAISGSYKVGGIVGDFRGIYVSATQYVAATISKCYNNSAVTASITWAGGIVGGIAMGTSPITECIADTSFSISECGNSGSISAGNYAGGISGVVLCAVKQTDFRKIENCFNQGLVTATGLQSITLLGDASYCNPHSSACYVASAITFRTASAYDDSDVKICDIFSSYNAGELILPSSGNGLKTTGGIGAGSDNCTVYSLVQSETATQKLYPLSGNASYKTESQMRELTSTLGTAYFSTTSGYPILKNLSESWYYKPTVTAYRVYGDVQTNGSVWTGTPVTNIPTDDIDLTYNIANTADDGYSKQYYAEKSGSTLLTEESIIKGDTAVYVKYQVPVAISGNSNSVTVNKWQGEQLLLTDFNGNATLQKDDNIVSGIVGQALPLTITAPSSYTAAYTPITHTILFKTAQRRWQHKVTTIIISYLRPIFRRSRQTQVTPLSGMTPKAAEPSIPSEAQ